MSKVAIVDEEFQFHNGTINTQSPQGSPAASASFQFHNGTINTVEYARPKGEVSAVSIPQRYN